MSSALNIGIVHCSIVSLIEEKFHKIFIKMKNKTNVSTKIAYCFSSKMMCSNAKHISVSSARFALERKKKSKLFKYS